MREWTVTVVVVLGDQPSTKQVTRVSESLAAYAGDVAGGPGHRFLGATVTIEGDSQLVGADGVAALLRACAAAGLDVLYVAAVQAMTCAEHGRRHAKPPPDA
jgi:CTP:molybdopterin cytidylyltransferase MocA